MFLQLIYAHLPSLDCASWSLDLIKLAHKVPLILQIGMKSSLPNISYRLWHTGISTLQDGAEATTAISRHFYSLVYIQRF